MRLPPPPRRPPRAKEMPPQGMPRQTRLLQQKRQLPHPARNPRTGEAPMDQVRKILAVIKKHHFWMLTGIGASIVLVCWFVAQSQIDAAYNKNKTEIEGKFKAVQGLQGGEAPSPAWAPEVVKLTEGLSKDVTNAWAIVYDRQKSVLVWPEVLGPEFATAIQAIKDKKASSEGPAPTLADEFRENYKNIFAGEMGLTVG